MQLNTNNAQAKIDKALERKPWNNTLPLNDASNVLSSVFAATPFGVLYDPNAINKSLGYDGGDIRGNFAGFGIAAAGLGVSYLFSALGKKLEGIQGASIARLKKGVLEDMKVTAAALEEAALQEPENFKNLRNEFIDSLRKVSQKIEGASIKQLEEALVQYNRNICAKIPQDILDKHKLNAIIGSSEVETRF